MNETPAPVLVELYLEGCHISGVTNEVKERRRLVDVLNAQGDLFDIESAHVRLQSGYAQFIDLLRVQKQRILIAVPRETDEQSRRRAVLTSFLGQSSTVQTPVSLLVPPLFIAGTAHTATGFGRLKADPASFTRFFPLTGARVSLGDGTEVDMPIVLVNRDAIAALSQTGRSIGRELS